MIFPTYAELSISGYAHAGWSCLLSFLSTGPSDETLSEAKSTRLIFERRNHYADGKRPQEAYVWPTVAEASRRVIAIRYSLLTYIYTLFYYAHSRGDTVMRALAWEFPNDISLRATDTQFMLGPSLLVTPALHPNTTTVTGVFPGIEAGTRWYDWYTLQEVKGVKPQENVTMIAPLEHINLHVRGGSILPMQQPGNTTVVTKAGPYSLLIAPDVHDSAAGSLYLDDGESVMPNSTKMVEVSPSARWVIMIHTC